MPDFSPVIPIDLSGGSKPTPNIHVPSLADPRDYNPNYVNPQLATLSDAQHEDYQGDAMDLIESQNKPTQVPKKMPFNPSLQDRYTQLPFNPTANNENIYGENQGFASQLFNGIAKGVGDAAISFGQALTFQPNAEWAEEGKQKMENLFPNYYTDKQKNSYINWLPFSGGAANFWGDKIFKGTGDMIGMIGATAIQDMAIGAVTEGMGEIPLIGNQVAKISMRASKYLTGVDRGAEFLNDIGLEGSELKNFSNAMAARNLQNMKGKQLMLARNFGTNFLFSHYMAAQGSTEFANSFKSDLMQQYRDSHGGTEATGEDLSAIQDDVESARNARYSADLGLFMAQSLALPGLLRAFRPASSSLVKGIEAESGKVKLPEAPSKMADIDRLTVEGPKGGVVMNRIVKPFVHGAAVMGGINAATESSTEAIKQYFKDKESGANKNGDVLGNLYKGFGKTLGTAEGLGSVLTSAIIGGLVGNAEHEMSSFKTRRAGLATPEQATKIAVDNMNKWGVSGLFKNNYDAASNATAAESDMAEAIKTGDPFKYKSAQKDAFYNFVLSGLKNNMHDIRLEQLKMMRDLPDQELQGVFGDSKTDAATQRQYLDSLIKDADRIKRKYDAIGDVVAQPYVWRQNPRDDEQKRQNEEFLKLEGYKDMLTKYSWDKEYWKDNLNQLELKNKEVHGNLSNHLLEALTTRDGRNNLVNEYTEAARHLDEDLNNKDSIYKSYNERNDARTTRDKYSDLADRLKNVQNMENVDPIAFSKVFTDSLNFELNGRDVRNNASIPMEEAMPLIERGVEVQYSKDNQKAAEHIYNDLFTQDGYDDYAAEADSYKKGQGIADSQVELNKINEEHAKYLADNDTKGESKLYMLEPNKELKPYTVSRTEDSRGDTVHQVKGWDGDVISTHPDRKSAEASRDELNNNSKFPERIESDGERNDDGSVKATNEKGEPMSIHPKVAAHYIPVDTPKDIVEKRGTKNQELLNTINDNSGSLPELPTQSSDTSEGTDDLSAEDSFKFIRKMKQFVFRSTVPSPYETAKDYNKRTQHFFSNIASVKSKIAKGNLLRMRMVTSANEDALGLTGLSEHMLKGVEDQYPNSDNGKRLVVAVFQEYDPISNTHHFVDANGNRLDPAKDKDFDKYILAPMPTTDITYKSEGLEGVSRFQEGVSKADQAEEAQAWNNLRKDIFNVTRAEDTPSYDFALSRGLGKRNKVGERDGKPIYEQHAITTSFDVRHKLDAFDQVIQVNTGTYMPDFIGDNVRMPKGSIILRDSDSYSFQILNNRRLNEREVNNVFDILSHYADVLDNGVKAIKDSGAYVKRLEDQLSTLNDKENKTDEDNANIGILKSNIDKERSSQDKRGSAKAIIEDIIDYLGGLTYFNRGRKDEGASPNEIYFSNDNKGTLVIAGKEFYFTSGIFNKEGRDSMMNEIKEALATAWTNVNNKKLNERKPFRELSVEDGKLVSREWKSYQHFLISDTHDLNGHVDNGKPRSIDDIPVTTSIIPLDKNNTLESNYEAKYAIVKDNQEIRPNLRFEANVKKQEKKAPPEKKAVKKAEEEATLPSNKYSHPAYSKVVGEFAYSVDEEGVVHIDESEVDSVYDAMKTNPDGRDAMLMGLGVLDASDVKKTGKEKDFRVREAISNLMEDLAAKEWLEKEHDEEIEPEDAQVEAKVEAAKVEPEKIIDLTGMAEAITSGLYDAILDRLKTDKATGERFDKELKEAFKEGKLKTVDDVKLFMESLYKPSSYKTEAAKEYENKPKMDDFEFRFVNANEFDYTVHDLAKSETWFEKNIPMSFKRLNTLIDNGGMFAFGRYADMHAEWYDRAKKGTIEHEAFEGIWKSFTTAKERSRITKEFNGRSGSFAEHNTGKEIKYSEATPYQVKEQLAEELGQYVLDNKLYKAPKSTKGNFIARMFEDFVNWVKAIRGGHIKKMFDKINTGYYKDVAPVNDFRGLEKFDTNKEIPGLSASQTFNIVRGTTVRVMQFLMMDNRSLVDFDVRGDKGIKKLLEKVHTRFNTEFNDNTRQGTVISRFELGQVDPKHADAINEAQYRNFQKVWKAIDDGFYVKDGMTEAQKALTVEGMVREYLGTFGVKVTEIRDDGEVPEDDEAQSANKKIIEDSFTIDVKKNALASIKLLLGTIVDGSIEGGVRIEKREKATNMPVPVEYGKVFSYLSDTLKDFNTFPEKIAKLRELSINNANIRDILKRLKVGTETAKVSLNDVKLRAAFNNTFGKQRPEAWTYYLNRDGSTVFSAQNLNVSIRAQREAWADAIKVDAVNQGLVKIKADGTYVFNPDGVKREGGIGTEAGMLRFLSDLGIDFTKEMRNKLSREKAPNQTKSDYDRFNDAVVGIYEQFHKAGIKDREFNFGGTGQAGRFNDLAELYLKSLGISESTYYNIEGKQQSQDVGTNFISKTSNDINNSLTKDELFIRAPHMRLPFRADGVYLNDKLFNGNIRTKGTELSADILQGILERGELASNPKPLAAMTHPDRVMAELNANLAKFYYVLVPADAKQEWVQKLDHIVTLQDFERGEGWDKLYNIFNKYYQTERAIAFDRGNGSIDPSYKSITHEFMGGYEKPELDRATFEKLVNKRTEELIDYLKLHKLIAEKSRVQVTDEAGNKSYEVKYSIPKINLKFLTENKLATEQKRADRVTMTEDSIKKLFLFTEANYMVNNVEFHKLYFGDPADIKDPLKRYKSFLSPRQESLYGDQEFNDVLNRDLNRLKSSSMMDAEGTRVHLDLLPGEYGYSIHTDFINTVVASDQKVYQPSLAEDAGIYPDDTKLGDQIRKAYAGGIDPTDGGGFTTVMGHREMTYRKGQVTKDHDRMYNFIMADDRQLMLKDGYLQDTDPNAPHYYRPELKAYDEEMVAKGYQGDAYMNVYKPIYSGVDDNGKTVLDKDSLAPNTYRLVRGTPMEKLYMNMVNDNIHYVVFKSGRKIGAGKTYDIYNSDGKVNAEAPSKDMHSTLLWKYFGIQVETEGRHHSNALGTQSSTMVAMNLQRYGIPEDFRQNKDWHSLTEDQKLHDSDIYRLVRHNQSMMTAMQRNGYSSLLRKLGIEEETDGEDRFYTMKDKTKLEKLLRKELLQRDATQNQKDALSLNKDGEFTIPLDAAANFKQIKQILYSKVEKDIAKIKQNGGPKVMVPGIMVGSVDGKEIRTVAGKKHMVSDGLKFYEAKYENGKRVSVGRMEVMITSEIPREMRKHPRWANATDQELMEHLTSSEEGKKVLEGIGFRIPTQELNSIDAFVVKGFLPDYLGDTVVVPEAITTKAGSDFDIDKLNTYLKNIYIDKDGNAKQIPYFGKDAAAREKLGQLLNSDVYKAVKEKENVDDVAAPDEEDVVDEMGEDELDKLFKKSLQNEYYDSMSKLILHPSNYERLIKPNSADRFKDISATLERTAPGEFTADAKGSLLSRMFMSQMRQAFVGGKNDVGIAASNQKNHSLNQLVNLYIDADRLELMSGSDRKFLGDCRILLPHNTLMGQSTISGITDFDGNYISDNLSQCIDGYVDIAKGAWIMNIVQDTSQAGTFMFLLKMGVVPETAAMFMNQPIIREYVKILKASGSTYALRDVKSPQRMRLQELFPVGIDTSKKNPKWSQQYNKLINKAQKNGLNIADFEKNIGEFYNDGKIDGQARNIEQHAILKEFLKYTVMADHNFKIQQALTFDTNPDPDPAMQAFKQRQVVEALTSTIFSNVEKLYEQSHIGSLRELIGDASSSMSEGIFKSGGRELGGPAQVTNRILAEYPTRMSKDNKMRASNAVPEAMISYIVQTGTGIYRRIGELLTNDYKMVPGEDGKLIKVASNMAKRFVELRKSLKEHPDNDLSNNIFFKELMVSAKKRRTDVKNVFVGRKASDSFTMDMYTDAMREFRDNPLIKNKFDDFYNDLVTTGFLQSGSSNSRQAFAKIVPSEDWAKLVAPVVMDDANWQPDKLQAFLDSDVFFRNQWRNKYLTPLATEKWDRDSSNKYTDSDSRFTGEVIKEWKKFVDNGNAVYTPQEMMNAGRTFTTRPGYGYEPFRIKPNSKEGQYRFITFSAVDAEHHNRQEDLFSADDKKQLYFLKRLHDTEGNPVKFMGDYIYVPISPRGDGVNAQEYTDEPGPSAIKTDCFNVKHEYPEADIVNFFEALKEERDISSNAIDKDKGTMDDPYEFKMPKDGKHLESMEKGEMTGISFSEKDAKNNPVNPGSIVKFSDGESEVLVRAITGWYPVHAIRPETWARVEGRPIEEYKEANSNNHMQFLFRAMDPISGELVSDMSPAEYKPILGWKRVEKKVDFTITDPATKERTKEVKGYRINFTGHPDLKLIAYEDTYQTKSGSTRTGWTVADEETGTTQKSYYQNSIKEAVDSWIRTTNRSIEDGKNTESLNKLNLAKKDNLVKSEKTPTFVDKALSKEEIGEIADKNFKDHEHREKAIADATALHDRLLKELPEITKDELKEKIDCFLSAPF